ncbi:hypothetical protein [Cellulomonas massiliensis]|uniref:hypothetical protein n=1 Tax=Cellulomonas massiliensis TaxID=1465811 RepID=UPI0002EE4582|nr:hypothetical protein [Cellulomonas massiliensis]
MTRFAVDALVVARLLQDGLSVPPAHSLVGPAVLRSDVLALLYRSERAGELDPARRRALLDALAGLRIRLLGDRVSRATAWRIASDLEWDDPRPAEYLAVATLQADALVALDPVLVEASTGLVPTASVDELLRP